MVRRAPSSAPAESSQIERSTTKEERIKAEKVKKEKVKESRRARVDEEEEEQGGADELEGDEQNDDQEDEDEDEDEGLGSPKGRKRARIDEDGEARAVKGERKGKARVKTLPRGEDGFVPGSIVRIQLRNFVTYDWVEFRPGPYLNMILGPNGTGKSSIACAICLGLNWPPNILGRASELNSFVKLGSNDGHIEIELKGPPGKPNLVIKRNLSAKSKGSSFLLNGSSATGTEIKSRMMDLNVQVGNLCSFLPQDKVSEFAQMSSQQLLKETQRAAGDENLTAWHRTLIESGKELKAIQDLINGERDQLKQMQERNDGLEREVERFHQRREIEQRIEDLELLIPMNEYREAKLLYLETKERQRALHNVVKQLQERNAPAQALLNTYAKKHDRLTKAREDAKKKCAATFKKMKSKWDESDKLEKEADDLGEKLVQQKEGEKKRQMRIKTIEKAIAQMQHELDNPPEIENLADIHEEMRRLNEGRAEARTRQAELHARQSENADASGREKAQLDACYKDLKMLDDAGQRKLENLKRWDKDTYDAVIWLRQNQDKFKQEIIEPPCLCLSVKDKRFANAVEACFNANQLKMFVAQNEDDYKTLNNILNDSERVLRKGGRVNTWYRGQQGLLAGPPMSAEEMTQLGFQGYAIEYVDCPEGLMWFLQRDLNLHRTAVGLDSSKVPVAQAMEAVSRFGSRGEGGGATFIAGTIMNIVSRSRYGKKVAQNLTRDVRPARNLGESAIDPAEKQRIDDRIKTAKTALAVIEEETNRLSEEDAELQKDDKEYRKNHAALTTRKQTVVKAGQRIDTLRIKIGSEQKKLSDAQTEPSIEAKTAQLRQDILKLTKQRLKIAKHYTELMRSLIRDQADNTRVALEYAQVGANKTALENLCQEKGDEFQKALAEFNEAHATFEGAKAASKDAVRISKAAIADASDEQRERFNAMDKAGTVYDRNAEQLRGDLETEKNNLEMNRGANPGVVAQYERRKEEIERLTGTVQGREKNAEKIERAIKNARDNWEPALERLVASIGKKFSTAFDRIGCAGEIRINRHEDFDKWAIDILVKFRENERLQLLTAQRQSGGERSLTTILYLMSLTEEARSPFSLVDEINQGMDMRAERAVHNSLVETTCKPDSAQYFLITPKLLPDLHYHERMKVLCVNNGEWLPEENDLGNMMNMIKAFAQRRERSSKAA